MMQKSKRAVKRLAYIFNKQHYCYFYPKGIYFMLFRPKWWLKSVLDIDREFLEKTHIRGFILDLDNTLSMHGSPAAEKGVFEWLDRMRDCGIRMYILSNNTKQRVEPLARELGLPFFAFGCKPLPGGIRRAISALKLPKSQIALVGDQIFTDMIGGNVCGIQTILVEPFHLENKLSFRFKRKLESVVFKRDYSLLETKNAEKK